MKKNNNSQLTPLAVYAVMKLATMLIVILFGLIPIVETLWGVNLPIIPTLFTVFFLKDLFRKNSHLTEFIKMNEQVKDTKKN